jgi:hypothetical protein
MTSGGNRYPAYDIGLSAAMGNFLGVGFMSAILVGRPALTRCDQQVDSATSGSGWPKAGWEAGRSSMC